MKVVNFRVQEAELTQYKTEAGRLGMSLSDWLRMRCRIETPTPFESERPRADKCVHGRRKDQYCVRCDRETL